MILIPVKKLPDKKGQTRCRMKNLEKLLADFMNGTANIVRVELNRDDYDRVGLCRTSLRNAVVKYRYPIKVHCISGHVYLAKEK